MKNRQASHRKTHGQSRFRPIVERLERRELLSATFPDFNGDGFDDLAIGVPFEELDGIPGAGAVSVLYGTANGLTEEGDQLIGQNSTGIGELAEVDDNFGAALGWGDFNNDGFDDLAVGVPGETVGGKFGAGVVHIIFGTRFGLNASGSQIFSQDSLNVPDRAEVGDAFGFSITTGDFNGDGYDDLAVGVPFEDIGTRVDAGGVNTFFGSAAGVTTERAKFWSQNTTDIKNRAHPGDLFGYSLTTGYFNGDGYAELAIGVPGEDVGGNIDAGAVHVLRGSVGGLLTRGNQFWTQNSSGVPNTAEPFDEFGFSLSSGDFDRNTRDDLAIGIPGENNDAGAVTVLFGANTLLTSTGAQFITQSNSGVPDNSEPDDRFGFSLAAADYDGDTFDDLAIGVPGEDVGDIVNAGAVDVLYGWSVGLRPNGAQHFTQNTNSIEEESDTDDFFAFALAAGDYNGDGFDDLAIGVPFEDIGSIVDAGAVNVLYSTLRGVNVFEDDLWTQLTIGIQDLPETGDGFGYALSRR